MKAHDLMDDYDTLCLEQEKQAALIEMLRRALGVGQVPQETLISYVLIMEEQHTSAVSAAQTLYETALQQEKRGKGA